jgi:lipopolysaccharide/colanic/teichoic acid biosynthesis glycosyltransferase
LSIAIANHPMVQRLTMSVPVFSRLPTRTLSNGSLTIAMITVLLIVLIALFPLYKPRPRRIIDVVAETQRRVILAAFALATIGYFDYTYRLPRSTLVLTTVGLLVFLPAWNVLIRRQKRSGAERVIIVGDDPKNVSSLLEVTELPIVGYVSLNSVHYGESSTESAVSTYTDGGAIPISSNSYHESIEYLGGISRLSNILVEHNADTVILAFTQADRQEFFGVLNTCYSHGVTAKVHREFGNSVLTSSSQKNNELVDIDLEPWDWQDRAIKRLFDLIFATVGLVLLSPLVLVIALAIKLDSPGSVIYAQERTSTFGGTFPIYKFRTMVPEGESATPIDDAANDRITHVGQTLRKTHLDEIPQLWAIFTGEMSVVGPRAVWTDEEKQIQKQVGEWQKRWFVKPGLTGLAQINEISSTNPEQKLGFDLDYIRQQSFWFDVKIVLRQVYKVIDELI